MSVNGRAVMFSLGNVQRILRGANIKLKYSVLVNWRPAPFSFFWILKGHHDKSSKKPFSDRHTVPIRSPLTRIFWLRGVSDLEEQLSTSTISANSKPIFEKIGGMNQGSIRGRFMTKSRDKKSCATVLLKWVRLCSLKKKQVLWGCRNIFRNLLTDIFCLLVLG